MPLLTMVLSFPNKTVTSDLDVLTKIMKYDKKYNSPVKYGIATKLTKNCMFNKLTSWENQMIDNKKVIIVFYSLISSLPLKCFCCHHHLLFHFLLFQRKYRRLLMMITEQQHSIAHLFLDSGRPATELLRSSSVLLKNGLQSLPFSPQHPYAPEQGDLLNKGVTLQLFALPKMKKR